MEIVLVDVLFVVEGMVCSCDVGFVYVGQCVVVKVDVFLFGCFGMILGCIVVVFVDVIDDEKFGVVFMVCVVFDLVWQCDYVLFVLVGMMFGIDIKIGNCCLIDYFISLVCEIIDGVVYEC